jgi:hypothetical protein
MDDRYDLGVQLLHISQRRVKLYEKGKWISRKLKLLPFQIMKKEKHILEASFSNTYFFYI